MANSDKVQTRTGSSGHMETRSSLGRRLLWLTILFVMLAEIAIFLPSAAAFRTEWLQDRVQAARLILLGVEVAEDMMVSEEVAEQMLATAGIMAVRINRDGISELVLPAPVAPGQNLLVDMRTLSLSQALIETCDSLLLQQPEYLRVVDQLEQTPGDFLEILVREKDLRTELFAFSIRTFWMSLLISVLAGGLIYFTLNWLFVRPMRKLSQHMVAFREAPEDPTRLIEEGQRKDEIGVAHHELAMLQKEVQSSLQQKSRLAALGEAVAKINHDLRNILTSAQLVSDRLADSPDPKTRQMGERLVRSIDRGVALCRSTLDFGKSSEPKPVPQKLTLHMAIEDAWQDASSVRGAIQWQNRVARESTITMDPEHLYRILFNLLRNAVQAMPEAGELRITQRSESGFLVLEIADSGHGIPARLRKTLFTAFAGSSGKSGTGLGLAIARELARANGGDVLLASTSGAGSLFQIKLPL